MIINYNTCVFKGFFKDVRIPICGCPPPPDATTRDSFILLLATLLFGPPEAKLVLFGLPAPATVLLRGVAVAAPAFARLRSSLPPLMLLLFAVRAGVMLRVVWTGEEGEELERGVRLGTGRVFESWKETGNFVFDVLTLLLKTVS